MAQEILTGRQVEQKRAAAERRRTTTNRMADAAHALEEPVWRQPPAL
jgi:hypothetical protein